MAQAPQGLTEDELALFTFFGEFWTGFRALPQLHPSDLEEAAFHLHALGRIIGMMAAHRAHPDVIQNRSGTPIEEGLAKHMLSRRAALLAHALGLPGQGRVLTRRPRLAD